MADSEQQRGQRVSTVSSPFQRRSRIMTLSETSVSLRCALHQWRSCKSELASFTCRKHKQQMDRLLILFSSMHAVQGFKDLLVYLKMWRPRWPPAPQPSLSFFSHCLFTSMCHPISCSDVANELCDARGGGDTPPLAVDSGAFHFQAPPRPQPPHLTGRRLRGAGLRPRHLAPPTQGSARGREIIQPHWRLFGLPHFHTCAANTQTCNYGPPWKLLGGEFLL